MTVKKYLSQIKDINSQIDILTAEKHRLMEIATSITAQNNGDVVQGSTASDKVGNTVAKICDIRNEINDKIDMLVDIRSEILNVVCELKDPFKTLIYQRYFELKSWYDISVIMNYDEDYVKHLHGYALLEVDRILKKDTK